MSHIITLVRPRELARAKRISPNLVYEAIDKGELNAIVRIGKGGSKRFFVTDVDANAWQPK